MQHLAAADRVAGDDGDDRFWNLSNLALEVEDVEAWHAVVADVAPVAANALIATGAESLGAGAGEEHDSNRRIGVGVIEGFRQLEESLRAKGVAYLRAVDR